MYDMKKCAVYVERICDVCTLALQNKMYRVLGITASYFSGHVKEIT